MATRLVDTEYRISRSLLSLENSIYYFSVRQFAKNGETRRQSFWDFLSDFDVQQRVKQYNI